MADLAPLKSYLHSVAQTAAAGEKLPTIRRLMKDFGLSQANIERVLNGLKLDGLIVSHVGRGTFFTGSRNTASEPQDRPAAERAGRSVILFRRSFQSKRGRFVYDLLQQKIADAGDLTLDVGYSDGAQARQIIQSLPRFDACIVQNSFDIMPVDMIAAIRRKTETIVVDGAWLVGTDVDAVGFEWGEPVAAAVRLLVETGHDHITLVTTQSFFLANELGLHRYRCMRDLSALAPILQPEVRVPRYPPLDYDAALVAAIAASPDATTGARRAVIVWGVENGLKFKQLLAAAGFQVPDHLSVILLGRTDLEEEADGFFHMFGYSAIEQADGVFNRVRARWKDPTTPFGLHLMPMRERAGISVRGVRPAESRPHETNSS